MTLTEEAFGRLPDGTEIRKFTLANTQALEATVISYGGALVSLRVPDRRGRQANVNLGFDSLEGYLASPGYLGALLGRFANRIRLGRFTLEGREYSLPCNNPSGSGPQAVSHHLHGGVRGFSKVAWKARGLRERSAAGVVLEYLSRDGEEGYPGTLKVRVTYRLTEQGELSFEYSARTDRATPLNLSQHSYWNLAGAGSGSITDHELTLHCPFYLPVDPTLIPTGEVLSVKGTPFDFTRPKVIGRDLGRVPGGYDHCFVVAASTPRLPTPAAAGTPRMVAQLYEPASGRVMEVYSSMPAVQFYTGNFLDGLRGSSGAIYNRHAGLCLETEYFPDAPNQPHFPSCILHPGQEYRHITIHRFYTR
jgi:aldose 1-epimerase